jgi:hypothetical protein
VTTLIEELRIAVRGIWQSIGFGASANTAATVVPVLVVGIALNLIVLHAVDRIHPIKEKTRVVDMARAELKVVQTVTASMLRQIEGHERGRSLTEPWAPNQRAETAHCHIATDSDRVGERNNKGLAFPCGERNFSMSARKVLHAI